MSSRSSSSSVSRPIAGFHPCIRHDHLLQFKHHDQSSLTGMKQQIKEVQEDVDKVFTSTKLEDQLTLIDTLERLGVSYHYEEKIDAALLEMYTNYKESDQDDLHRTSTRFRILRQHGFPVPCDGFNKFKDENGKFKETLAKDVVGILSLYEACHVRTHGEDILDEALEFTTACLKDIGNSSDGTPFAEQVAHALHQPLHKGMPRLEARHYISVYEKDPSHDKSLLRFAKLDYNHLQSLHRNELHHFARWWKHLHLKVPFSRDRLGEAYFWIVGVYHEPKYMFARKILQKMFKAACLLDDTYDAYGTTEELELLTAAIQRWDKECVEELPEHVKWTFKAILEAFDDAEEELARLGNSYCIAYAKDQMKMVSEAQIEEVKWRDQNYIPRYEEYMKVARITSPYPFGIVASFLGMETATKAAFEWQRQSPLPEPIAAASEVLRLLNDLYGHKFEQKRKHVASVVQCYMERHGMKNEEEIHEEVLKKVDKAWKDINKAMIQPFVVPKPMLDRVLNWTRAANVIYKGEDGFTTVSDTMKANVDAVLFHPIPI